MNRKGFTLVEFLGCMAILAVILGIGLYTTRGTLSTTLSTLTDVSENEIFNAAKSYVLENNAAWINGEYACVTVSDLVDDGYFKNSEVDLYKNEKIRVTRDTKTKIIDNINFVSECK